jgi:hypothetical protein
MPIRHYVRDTLLFKNNLLSGVFNLTHVNLKILLSQSYLIQHNFSFVLQLNISNKYGPVDLFSEQLTLLLSLGYTLGSLP